jgi:hypothetical protein
MTAKLILFALLLAGCAWSHPGPGIVVDHLGQVYFVHGVRSRIMKVDVEGKLSIFVQGEEGGKLSVPHHLCMDTNENLYSVGDRDSVVWRIAPDGKTTQFYPAPNKGTIGMIGSGGDPFTLDSQGNIYFVQSEYGKFTQISKLRPDGRIIVLAGGDYGFADGRGEDARFGNLHVGSFAWCPDGWLAVSDSMISIRKMAPAGRVFTLTDESGKKLQFKGARGLASDRKGNLFVADGTARQIFKITSAGRLTTVAGTGEPGDQDGPAAKATFLDPAGVFADSKGAVYVLDYLHDDPRVRKISAEGSVTTIAKTESSR